MISVLKKSVDYGVWIIFSTLFVFSLIFIITENLVPGNRFFGTKLALEKGVIMASAILNKQFDLQINIVSRRYEELAKVINSKYGSESLSRLDDQIIETRDLISRIKDPSQRKEAATKYVVELNYISSGLEKEQVTNNSSSISTQIDSTQAIIQETIDEMNQIQQQTSTVQPTTPTPNAGG